MKVNFARLCDYAMIGNDGKLSVVGIFDQIGGKSFPVVHPLAYLAFEIEFGSAEIGTSAHMEVQVRDADGGQIGKFSMEIQSGGRAMPGSSPRFRHFLPMRNMKFEKPGVYEFAFFLGGRYDESVRLEVVQRKP